MRVERCLRLRTGSGLKNSVVREVYLRDAVPCSSPLCLAGCIPNEEIRPLAQLPADVTHYVVPDCSVARNYLELFELPHISGAIFMKTVVDYVANEGGRRLSRRLQTLLRDERHGYVQFANEYQTYCHCQRKPGESMSMWQQRSVFTAANWYVDHLAGQIPVVLLSDDSEFKAQFGSETLGLFILPVLDYLDQFWPDQLSAKLLVLSIQTSLQSNSKREDFVSYATSETVEAGIATGRLIKGHLNVNKHNAFTEAFVQPQSSLSDGKELGDIYVCGQAHRNRAVHGDVVVCELLPKNEWKIRSNSLADKDTDNPDVGSGFGNSVPTGRVVGVVQRKWREYVATIAEGEISSSGRSDRILVVPYDYRIPKIRISTRHVATLRDHRFVVRIDSWDEDSQYPNGHFVRLLGRVGSLQTEIEVLLLENQIHSAQPFTHAQLEEMPVDSDEQPWQPDPKEVARRRDLRQSHLVFSVDPKGCEDVDDCLSVRFLDNGLKEVGVHIADVSYFVQPNSLTDLEARSRSTTVYLAHKRYDMLPEVLSANLCSLLSGVDRYAVSVLWKMDAAWNVIDVWYGRTVINSRYKLFYEMAQSVVDGSVAKTEMLSEIPELKDNSELDTRIAEMKEALCGLMDAARAVKARREADGALELEGIEVRVQLDKAEKIEDLVPREHLEIHETIAELMILANHWVAKEIAKHFPCNSLLRHHPLPRQSQFEQLLTCAGARGFVLDTQSNTSLAQSLQRSVDVDDPHVNKILRMLATTAMSNASYFCTNSLSRDQWFHYGLALDRYTHFTSPIRRYADILVHRLLLASVDREKDGLIGATELEEIAHHINGKHRSAQFAQRGSVELFQALYFMSNADNDAVCVTSAIIYQIRANGVLVYVPRYGVKSAVYVRNKEHKVVHVTSGNECQWLDGSVDVTDCDITVTSAKGKESYKLFDWLHVRVWVYKSNAHAPQLKLELCNKLKTSGRTYDVTEPMSRNNLIQNVKDADNAAQDNREVEWLGPAWQERLSAYGQSKPDSSVYDLLRELRIQSLQCTINQQ